MKSETSSHKQGKERAKKEPDHSRLMGGSLDEQGDLSYPQDKEFFTPICPILKVYIEALTAFSYVYHPGDATTLGSFKAVSLKMAPTVGSLGRKYIF